MIRKHTTKAGAVRQLVYVNGADGKRKSVGAYDSEKEAEKAERKATATQEMIADGDLPPEVDLDRTLGDACDLWLASLKTNKVRGWDTYDDHTRLYIKPHLGAMKLSRLRKPAVMAWRDEQATLFAANTVNASLTALSSAFAYFVSRSWIAANPCSGVKQLEVPEANYRWLATREDITRLLLHCPDELRDIVAVALATGARIDELLHVEWGDINLERRLITIHRGRKGTTKSGKLRRVPILDVLLPVLKARALKRDGARLVFGGRTGKVRTRQGVGQVFKRALKRAGLDTKLRFHDLRHTFASHWMMDGGCIFRLSIALGHSSPAITAKVYAHLAPTAWEQDYGRLAFAVPTEAKVYRFERGDDGRLTDRVLAAV